MPNIIGISHSEQRILCFKEKFPQPNIRIYRVEISDQVGLERIFATNQIDQVIHCAAMKNVGLCQDNVVSCINTNIVGSLNLVRLSLKYQVRDLVAVSTDKSVNPCCIYGMSKHLMEKMVLESGYRIFQGVNFLWSDGSVLEFWYKKYRSGQPLQVFSNAIRYFCDVNEICTKILTSPNQVITTDHNYRISIPDLLQGFCRCFSYDNYQVDLRSAPNEKQEEDLPAQLQFTEPTMNQIVNLLRQTIDQTVLNV